MTVIKSARGRPPKTGAKRTERVTLYLTEPGMAALDTMRGGSSRSGFIRDLIVAEHKRRNR